MAATEEAIRRKLLADGEGTGDDKRIVNLYKTFLRWAKDHSADNASDSDDDVTLRKLGSAVEQCLCMYKKSRKVCELNKEEIIYYKTMRTKIEQDIAEANQRITECKQELQEAKQIRKHRQEYDTLANLIEQHPERKDTLEQVEKARKEVDSMEMRKKHLEEKLELRKKQFHVLLMSLQELEAILERDEIKELEEEGPVETELESRETSVKPENMDSS